MLNKQGLFTRNTPLSNTNVSNTPSPTSSHAKSDEQFVMPGHLAAIESATSSATAHSSTTPASTASSGLSNSRILDTKITDAKIHAEQKTSADTASVGSKLIVGPDVKLKGAEILDCDTLVVEGRVEATMDSRVIQIAEKGAFSGKVGIDVAEIYGQFDGELTARSQLIIHASGRVSGKIRYGKIHIEEGGELSGDIAAIASGATHTDSTESVKTSAMARVTSSTH